MERKFSFVVNCTDADNYALVMTCWKMGEDGNRIDQHSEIKTNITLEETQTKQKQFIELWQTIEQ
jgi:hypothetical protein